MHVRICRVPERVTNRTYATKTDFLEDLFMDMDRYNQQAKDWRKMKVGDPVASMTYSVAHADVVDFVTDAVEDPDPWYLKDSPFGGPIVPPGFFYDEFLRLLVAANFPMGVLNAKMVAESKGPIMHGELVHVKGSISNLYEKRGRPYMDIAVVISDKDGVEKNRGVVTVLLE